MVSLAIMCVEYETFAAATPPPFFVPVLDGERGGRARIVGQRLSAGERGCVGGGLEVAVGPEPRADVQDGRGHPDQNRDEHDHDDGRLPALPLSHSTRSVVVEDTRPDWTTTPSRLISYG